MNPTLKIDTTRFDAALRVMFLETKRTQRELVEEAYRGVIGMAIGLMPPMQGWKRKPSLTDPGAGESSWKSSYKPDYSGGKAAGEAGVRINLAALFVKSSKRYAKDDQAAALLASKLKAKTSAFLKPMEHKLPITASKYNELLRLGYANIGSMAAGWNAAASRFGVRGMPSWISRHGNKHGSISITETATGFAFSAVNNTKHRNSSFFQSQLQMAVTAQAAKMERRSNYVTLQNAKKSGFNVL